ncbi:sulfurtransferase [Xenophilus sp. AP218F]|nr:rhodanese-like domain-containing protein [Chromobacterium sp. ASV5]OWY38099.1 sulfurtransferase [Xenophilus sp. AP218F]
MVREISAPELAARLADSAAGPLLLLDVREGWEWDIARIEGSVHMPMNLIPLRQGELPDGVTIVAICHHGVRSAHVAMYLQDVGFDDVLSLAGGVEAWASQVDPTMARY